MGSRSKVLRFEFRGTSIPSLNGTETTLAYPNSPLPAWSRQQIRRRIDALSVNDNLEIQMRAERQTRTPDHGNLLDRKSVV